MSHFKKVLDDTIKYEKLHPIETRYLLIEMETEPYRFWTRTRILYRCLYELKIDPHSLPPLPHDIDRLSANDFTELISSLDRQIASRRTVN